MEVHYNSNTLKANRLGMLNNTENKSEKAWAASNCVSLSPQRERKENIERKKRNFPGPHSYTLTSISLTYTITCKISECICSPMLLDGAFSLLYPFLEFNSSSTPASHLNIPGNNLSEPESLN